MSYDYGAIAKEIVDEHVSMRNGETFYEPCYFSQGYSDTNEEVVTAYLSDVRDKYDFPHWRELTDDAMSEWQSDCIWLDAKELSNKYVNDNDDLSDNFDEDNLREEVRYALEEANTQDVGLEWIRNMRNPIVRFQLGDNDDPEFTEDDEDMTPEVMLSWAGLEHTEKNLKAARVIIDNAYYPGCYRSLFLVFNLPLSNIEEGDKVHIKGEAELWACNPYAGDGMADTVEVDLTIDRSKLATDAEAPGYSYEEVFGPVRSMIPEPTVTFIKSESEVSAD